ncbi:MAG TPA: hypothetical protein VFE56_08070 [Candidatus Binataceae bacterium]|nr:hypothetical protein [Candidatus Binataceae bacterium]
MTRRYIIAIVLALACPAAWSMAQPSRPIVRNPDNPPLFQRFLAPPSGVTRFLLSKPGLRLVRKARTPAAIAILKALGEPLPPTSQYPAAVIPPEGLFSEPELEMSSTVQQQMAGLAEPLITQMPQAPVVSGCGVDGTVFNLEPAANAAAQNGESTDFIYNGVAPGVDLIVGTANDFRDSFSGLTGYYVHRAPGGCLANLEGVLPNLVGLGGEAVSANGNAAVAADPVHSAFFVADQHLGANATSGTTAIGLFRTSRANLLSTAVCPAGTQSSAQAASCWPQRVLVNPLPEPMNQYEQEYPSVTVDQRAAGVGAGDVYVTATEFDNNADTSRTWLVACRNNLSLCSAPVLVSGSDPDTAFSNVQVRPDGSVTVTYVNIVGFGSTFDIKFVSCEAGGAPFTPGCSPPVLVGHETQPLSGVLAAELELVATFPKHAHRVEAGVTQTFVVWARCKTGMSSFICPDADITMKYSVNGGVTWLGPVKVDVSLDDQFFPTITTDSSRRTVNIAYLNNHVDPVFQHRFLVDLVQIIPGSTVPTAPVAITSTPNDSSSGGLLIERVGQGDSIGLAARGTGVVGASRIYASYGYNLRAGTYSGVAGPQEDDYLTRLVY